MTSHRELLRLFRTKTEQMNPGLMRTFREWYLRIMTRFFWKAEEWEWEAKQ